jgi:hypothetical protein
LSQSQHGDTSRVAVCLTSSCLASGVKMPSKLKLYRSLLLLTGLQQHAWRSQSQALTNRMP